MVHFVGLDVSVKETSVCVVDDAGKVIFEQKVLTEPAGVCTTARDSAMASVEVLAGPERRRRWRVEQKQAIVAAAFRSGAVVRGASGRRDAEFGLPLAAGSSRRGEWLRSGAGGAGW
jgi:hypothetical protein